MDDKSQLIRDILFNHTDPETLFTMARELWNSGDLEEAATLYDRAFGLAPDSDPIRLERGELLDKLSVTEYGIQFRYIPAGPFQMGHSGGEPDEGPVHSVWLSRYWIAETPINWVTFCKLMGWQPPPAGRPDVVPRKWDLFSIVQENKIRWYYCRSAQVGPPPGEEHEFTEKPMVCASWWSATALAERLARRGSRYALPTEAQWEKAARGGLIGAPDSWGWEPPTQDRCDFDAFGRFSIMPMTALGRNGYGLYTMNGGVWEWTQDWYDRDYYSHSPDVDPTGPDHGDERVLRGGCWSDCAAAVTNSFRMSRACGERDEPRLHLTPTIGFRLCRSVDASAITPYKL